MKLYPFQQAGVQFLNRAPHSILGDEMGSGLRQDHSDSCCNPS